MVVVADGTDDAAERLERVLTTDPGMGVLRHADAGYDEALEAAARARAAPAAGCATDSDGRAGACSSATSRSSRRPRAARRRCAAPRSASCRGGRGRVRPLRRGTDRGRRAHARPRSRSTASSRSSTAAGACAVPGLVDCHTHACFAGDRVEEFALRAAGASYEELHAAGGGILSTVRATRAAGEEGLRGGASRGTAAGCCAHGTTTFEAKSGYGLDRETELGSLRVDRAPRAASRPGSAPTPCRRSSPTPTRTSTSRSPRCCPRPRGSPRRRTSSSSVAPSTSAQARRYLEACRAAGLALRLHGDQFTEAGGDPAGDRARRAHRSTTSRRPGRTASGALAASDVAAVLLPGARALPRPADAAGARARRRRRDRRPRDRLQPGQRLLREPAGRRCSLACTQLGLSPAEALAACTVNAAHVLGRAADRRPDRAGLRGRPRAARRAGLALPRLPPGRRARSATWSRRERSYGSAEPVSWWVPLAFVAAGLAGIGDRAEPYRRPAARRTRPHGPIDAHGHGTGTPQVALPAGQRPRRGIRRAFIAAAALIGVFLLDRRA